MKLLKTFYYIFLISAVIYFVYSSVHHTGIVGFIENLQLSYIGKAHSDLTHVIALFILLIPIALFSSQIKKQEKKTTPKPASTKAILIFTILPLLTSFVFYAYLKLEFLSDQKRKIIFYSFNSKLPFPKEHKFFRAEGVLRREEAIIYDIYKNNKKETTEYYIPFTSDSWEKSQAIQVLLKLNAEGFLNQGRYYSIVDKNYGEGKITIDIELSGQAPTFVGSTLRDEKHLMTDEPLLMVKPKDLSPTGLKGSFEKQSYFLIPIFGAILSVIFLFSGLMARKNKKGIL